MSISYDLWAELYEKDLETEFLESGHADCEHEEFVEDRFFAFLDSQDSTELDYLEYRQLGIDIPQD